MVEVLITETVPSAKLVTFPLATPFTTVAAQPIPARIRARAAATRNEKSGREDRT
jgi:hypothetical protein